MFKYKFVFLFLSLISHSAFAFSVLQNAVVRDDNFHADIQKVNLVDLNSSTTFEGKYFKIVKDKSNDAINFSDNKDLVLKAATTYFHLTKARSYFVNTVKSQFVKNMPQIVVRIDIKNVFNEVGHFANDHLNPQYNNALSVPAGLGYEPAHVKPWGNEIWFRPSRIINIKDFQGRVDYGGSVKSSLHDFRNLTHMGNLEQFMILLLSGNSNNSNIVSSEMRLVGSSLILEAIYQSSDLAAEFFTRKKYWLNSALVPEIIYHEFSHIALSNHLELSHSTPVNEGLADYFAGKISNSQKLAEKIKQYNVFNGKEVRKKQQYQLAFENNEYANSDFVFGLLWNIGEIVNDKIGSFFVYNMATRMDTNMNIRDDLIDASIETCKDFCENSLSDRIKLYEFFHSKNM